MYKHSFDYAYVTYCHSPWNLLHYSTLLILVATSSQFTQKGQKVCLLH